MTNKLLFLFLLMALLSLTINAQDHSTEPIFFIGKVRNIEDSHPLPYVSILLTKSLRGTVADSGAHFKFFLSTNDRKNDTLEFSHLGFYPYRQDMSKIEDDMTIYLQPAYQSLNDYTVKRMSAEEHIKQAVEAASENYDPNPYEMISYLENNIYENKNLLASSENVFKTYYKYAGFNTENKDYKEDHQLLLYRNKNRISELRFMKKEIGEMQKKADKKSKLYTEDIADTGFLFKFPPFIVPIYSTMLPIIDSHQFHNFKYTIKEHCSKRNLIVIEYKTKKPFKYEQFAKVTGNGNLYINCRDNAIVATNVNMQVSIPFFVKTALWFWKGVTIKDLTVSGDIQFSLKNKFYYPSKTIVWLSAELTKTRWFGKNDKSTFEMVYSMIPNSINTENVKIIPPEKYFSFRELNIQNDIGIKWEDVKKMGAEIY